MIGFTEVRQRARLLGVQEFHITRDYVLNHILAALAERPSPLIFRGGTALARVYWPDFRLSEDLDFLIDDHRGAGEYLREAANMARGRTRLELQLAVNPTRDGQQRFVISWDRHELLVDASRGRCELPVETRQLSLPYSDLARTSRVIATQALAEILGNKWYMLMDRREPRDVFDLWAALHVHNIPFTEVARGHAARYGFPPLREALDRAGALEELWEVRLAHQIRDLPPFREVLSSLAESFRGWWDSLQETK